MIPTFVTLTPNRGSRDDGKRLLSDGRFIIAVLAKQRGEFEGGGLEIGPGGRLRDDGKRFSCWTLYGHCFSERS